MSNTDTDAAIAQAPNKQGWVAHTPDPTKYHHPDERAGERMRSGIRAVMIPRATRYGGSLGFKAGSGVAHVEPADITTGAGGITLDLSRVNPVSSKQAYEQAISMTHDPEEQILRAYQLLGADQTDVPHHEKVAEPPKPVRDNPLIPNAYVVPESRTGGAQLPMSNPLTPGVDTRVPTPMPAHPQNASVQPSEYHPVAAPLVQQPNGSAGPDPAMVAMMAQMSNTMSELAHTVNDMRRPAMPPPTTELPRISAVDRLEAPSVEEPKEVKEAEEEVTLTTDTEIVKGAKVAMIPKTHAVKLLKDGMDSLKIPNLGVVAEKPKFRVEFDLGQMGRQSAWYHWVCKHGRGLFLIYDSRFEYGSQYSPPDLGPGQSIKLKLPDHDQAYNVYSTDFVHPFGCFNIVNLILVDDDVPLQGSADEVMGDAIEAAVAGIPDIME